MGARPDLHIHELSVGQCVEYLNYLMSLQLTDEVIGLSQVVVPDRDLQRLGG